MASPLYLLDTSVLVTLLSGGYRGDFIDSRFKLRASPVRPLVCIVSHGELRALARVNVHDQRKRNAMEKMLDELVTIDISDNNVLLAYEEVYEALRHHPGGARTNSGENDMWIAAAARATKATLVTLDTHFDPLFPKVILREYVDRNAIPKPPEAFGAGRRG